MILEAHLPGQSGRNIGVYLVDPATGRLWLRMRGGFEQIAEVDDVDVLEALEGDIRARAAEVGAEAFLESLEDSLSNVVRVGERQSIEVDAFSRVVDRLFDEHVEKIAVRAVPDACSALQLAGRRGPDGRGNGVVRRGLGACAGRHAARTRASSWRTWWALDGAAHSRWQPQPLPAESGRVAAEQDSAASNGSAGLTRRRVTPSRSTPATRSLPAKTNGIISASR